MVTTKLFVPKDPALSACSNNELTRILLWCKLEFVKN